MTLERSDGTHWGFTLGVFFLEPMVVIRTWRLRGSYGPPTVRKFTITATFVSRVTPGCSYSCFGHSATIVNPGTEDRCSEESNNPILARSLAQGDTGSAGESARRVTEACNVKDSTSYRARILMDTYLTAVSRSGGPLSNDAVLGTSIWVGRDLVLEHW